MQALITQEEWEEYRRLKRESAAEQKAIDARVAVELEKVAIAFISGASPNSYYSRDDIYEAIETAARVVRARINPFRMEIQPK